MCPLFRYLLNDSIRESDWIAQDDWMTVNTEMERTRKEVVVAQFLLLHLHGETDENYEESLCSICGSESGGC
jgi:hypothetical protein